MAFNLTILIYIILIPAVFLGLEFLLCRLNTKAAVVLPLVAACFFVLIGYYALILAGIMYSIFFTLRYLKKEKEKRRHSGHSELEKMNINDL